MLKEELLEYEKDFYRKSFCDKRENLDARIDDEFFEFGKSGKIYNKLDVIESLSRLDRDRNIEITSFEIKVLEGEVVMTNYISHEKDISISCLRTSIWKKADEKWRLCFHQGTIMELQKL